MTTEDRFKKELLDELLAGHDAKTVFENDGLLDELKKALAERILNAQLDHHLGQETEQTAGSQCQLYRPSSPSRTFLAKAWVLRGRFRCGW